MLAIAGLFVGCAAKAPEPVPSGAEAAALRESTSHPAFAGHAVQLLREGELMVGRKLVAEDDVLKTLQELALSDDRELRIGLGEGVSSAWIATVSGYAVEAGFTDISIGVSQPGGTR